MAKRSQRATKKALAQPTAKEIRRRRGDEQRTRRLLTIFGVLLGIAAVLLGIGAFQQYYLKPRAPVAVVNGTRISATDFADRLLFEKFRLEQRFGPLAASGPLAQQIQQYVSSQLPNQTFERMITDEVLRQEAARQNLTIPEDELLRAIQAEFNFFPSGTPTPTSGPPTPTLPPTATLPPGTPAPTVGPTLTPVIITEVEYKQEYDKFLADMKEATGLNEGYYRDLKRLELLYDRFRQQAIAAASIPATTLQVRARQIQVDTEDDAKKVVERLKAGEDFAKVAQEVSKDTTTKDQGGDLGYFTQGAKDPLIERAAFSLAVNTISDPIKVGEKWHIIQVTEAPAQRPIAEDDLRNREQQAVDNFINDLQSKATVERDFRTDAIPAQLLNPPTPVRPTSTPRGAGATPTPRP